jgi:hypothetical protein
MGCGSGEVLPERRRLGTTSILYLKVSKLITKNPFYDISLSDFENFINSLNDKAIEENNYNKEKIIDEIITKYLENEENFTKKLFKDVVNNLSSKFDNILQNNKDLIILILFFLYLFLSDNQAGKRKLFKEKIKILFNKTNINIKNNNENENENKYNISMITYLIVNLIQMYTSSFWCFFVFFSFLNYYKGYDSVKFEKMINKYSIIKEVDSIIENDLNDIKNNLNISPDFLNFLVISEINNKIKNIFEKVEEGTTTISLDDNEINTIADSIYDAIYINNYVDYLFFGENHEY